MTPDQYARWVADMIDAGRARSARQCAMMLGYADKHANRLKDRGGDYRLALACAALLNRVDAYE
tara:strand:+ start:14125 stop:14316 length:192 start_codon:yes stop_codon:yes gene_type:complete